MPSKESADINVLMMTGTHHIDLLRFCVSSIANTWDILPKLIISTDGSISTEEINQKLSFWKGKIEIQDWQDSSNYHKFLNRKEILKYAEAHAFGKKLSFILHHAEKYPVIWIDSDILFFKDFTKYIPLNPKGILCGGSEDWITAYDDKIVNQYPDLLNFPKFNAGLLYVYGKLIYEEFNLEEILEDIHSHYDFFTEQSIFARIASQSLGKIWTRDILKNFNDDKQDLKPMDTTGIIARHYTSNVRHLFWRDLFFNQKFER